MSSAEKPKVIVADWKTHAPTQVDEKDNGWLQIHRGSYVALCASVACAVAKYRSARGDQGGLFDDLQGLEDAIRNLIPPPLADPVPEPRPVNIRSLDGKAEARPAAVAQTPPTVSETRPAAPAQPLEPKAEAQSAYARTLDAVDAEVAAARKMSEAELLALKQEDAWVMHAVDLCVAEMDKLTRAGRTSVDMSFRDLPWDKVRFFSIALLRTLGRALMARKRCWVTMKETSMLIEW